MDRTRVQQKKKPVALHLMKTLRNHQEELLKGDVIEEPLSSEDATGWVSNMVIESKKWDPSKIRLMLDTQMMDDFIFQTHFPIPTSEKLQHEFGGSDKFLVLDLNHAFHQMELDQVSQRVFVFTAPFGL